MTVRRGWMAAVADELSRLYRPGQDFTLTEFYRLAESRLQAQYPENTTVQATIRQVLQRLRDQDLMRFHGGGRYTYIGNAPAPKPRDSLLSAMVYDLAAQITNETGIAASDYLRVARADDPDTAVRMVIETSPATTTFLGLHRANRLDLSLEHHVLEFAEDYDFDVRIVRQAEARLSYYSSEES